MKRTAIVNGILVKENISTSAHRSLRVCVRDTRYLAEKGRSLLERTAVPGSLPGPCCYLLFLCCGGRRRIPREAFNETQHWRKRGKSHEKIPREQVGLPQNNISQSRGCVFIEGPTRLPRQCSSWWVYYK